jgi:hypothetical protein
VSINTHDGYAVLIALDCIKRRKLGFEPIDYFEHGWCFDHTNEQVLNK